MTKDTTTPPTTWADVVKTFPTWADVKRSVPTYTDLKNLNTDRKDQS